MSLKGSTALASATILGLTVAWAEPAGTVLPPPSLAAAAEAHGRTTAIPPPPDLSSNDPRSVVEAYYPSLAQPTAAPATAPGSAPANPFSALPPAPAASPSGPAAAPGAVSANPFLPSAPETQAPMVQPAAPASAFPLEPPQTAPQGEAPTQDPIDEQALRYYAAARDLGRVGAEIRRLKLLYPEWNPPADLFAHKSGVDEQPLWDLYARGDHAGVRARIEATRARTPGWEPSADLSDKLADAEARAGMAGAAGLGDWARVLSLAEGRPGLLICANMDALWQVGEAYARLGDNARAFDLYGYILANCPVPEERLATWQKAAELLPPEGVLALSSYARPLPDGTLEFDKVRFSGLRQEMGDVAAGDSRRAASAAQLSAFAAYIAKSRSAEDAALFGWYYFGLEDWTAAASWFEVAHRMEENPKFLEGSILALRNGERETDALALAWGSWDASPEIGKIYVEMMADRLSEGEAAIDADELERFATVVERSRSALGAQTLGWHRLAQDEDDVEQAKEWFEKSVDWSVTEEGVIGLAVVASRAGEASALEAIKEKYGDEYASLRDFEAEDASAAVAAVAASAPPSKPSASTRTTSRRSGNRGNRTSGGRGGRDRMVAEAQAQFDSGNYEAALATLDQRQSSRGKSRDAELMRGWANYHLKRWDQARTVFKEQDAIHSSRDTRFGMGAVSNSQYRMWPE